MSKYIVFGKDGEREITSLKSLDMIGEVGPSECVFRFDDGNGNSWIVQANRTMEDVISFLNSDEGVFDCEEAPDRSITHFTPPF